MKKKQIQLDIQRIDKKNIRYREYIMKKAAIYKILGFLAALVIGAVLSLMIPLRPSVSVNEKRNLTEFPQFTWKTFLNGEYFSGIDTWFADTFPYRDQMIACNEKVVALYGFRDTVIHGEIVAGDEIPDVDFETGDINRPANQETTSADGTQQDTSASTESASPTTPSTEDTKPAVSTEEQNTGAQEGEQVGSVFVLGDAAYDYYAFSQQYSDQYVSVVNSLADNLAGKAKLYDIVVPTSMDIALDDNIRKSLSSSNQKNAILYMYSKMNANVNKTYVYDVLREHRSEYLYFRTDHHWTALGAYYTYSMFIRQLGMTPNRLESFEKMEFENFKGSFCTFTKVASLANNPDTLVAYKPMATNQMTYTDRQGTVKNYSVITDVTAWQPVNRYSAFIGGDNPYSEIHNPTLNDGSAVLVIKESYGNAFVPFLVDHFQSVYVVDYRYYKGTVSELVDSKGIQTVIMINNVAATSTDLRVNEMQKICR